MQKIKKNILVIMPESIGGRLVINSIADGLKCNGCGVKIYDELFDNNLDEVLSEKYDLITGYDFSALKIKIEKKLDYPVINYFSDEIRNKTSGPDWEKYIQYLEKDDCYTFYWDRKMAEKENFKNLFYLNHFVSFDIYKETDIKPEYDVMFAGRLDTDFRLNFFQELMLRLPHLKFAWYAIDRHFQDAHKRAKYPELLKRAYRGFIDNEEDMAKAINKTKIVFNINAQGISSLNYRTIQTAACKRLMISDNREELDIFEGYMPCYNDLDDLIKKIEVYLKDNQEYKKITEKCYELAKQKCNGRECVKYMLSKINAVKNIAIILASGSSERLNSLNTVKQFVKIAGKTVIEHTLEVFEKNKNIDEILIVTREDYKDYCCELVKKNKYKKVSKILKGGASRQESSRIGLFSIDAKDDINVLIHDAVRPFISDKIIEDCINALGKYQAVDVAIPSADTIIQVDDDNLIQDIPKRRYLRRGQTPQAFKLGVIKKAHEIAKNNPQIEVTDDCGLIKKLNLCDIFVVDGSDYNIKITYPIDIDIADKLFQIRSFDVPKTTLENLANKVIVIFGASRGIGKEILSLGQKYGAKVYGYSRKNNVDITKSSDVEKALKEVAAKEKRIDYVINTAGKLSKGKLEERTFEDILEDININYLGSINVTKLAIPYLKESQGGILLFASSSYTRGRADFSIYSSAKAALVNLTQAVAEELQQYNIKINIINPVRTATPMRFENFGKEPEGTLLKPETVALASLLTVCSDMSGQVVNVTKETEKEILRKD